MPSIVISCPGDSELAGKINNDQMSTIRIPSKDTIYISLSEDEVEIVLEKLGVSRQDIRKILYDFIKSDLELGDRYSLTEFDDVFIAGIPKSLDEMTINCELCEYIASTEEYLIIHENTWIDFCSLVRLFQHKRIFQRKSIRFYVTHIT